jgi:hypothetical protein
MLTGVNDTQTAAYTADEPESTITELQHDIEAQQADEPIETATPDDQTEAETAPKAPSRSHGPRSTRSSSSVACAARRAATSADRDSYGYCCYNLYASKR